MGLSTKVGSFNTGTGALGTTVVVNDVGFQPKVLLFWWNGRTDTVDASGRRTHQRGFGIATSSTDRRYATSLSQDTPTAMVTNTTQGNAACIGITTTADAIDGLMDVQSMDSGGFTLVVDDVFTASYRVHYLALGGSDITNAATGQFTANAAGGTGNQNITSVAFQPDFVLIFGTGQTTANNTVRADSRIMLGVANSGGQAVWAGGSNDAAANAQAVSYCRSGEFIAHLNTALTATEDRASFTGFLSNGFNINWSEVTTGGSVNHFLVIKGCLSVVGDLLTQTDTTTPIVESGFGFSPKATLLVSHGKAQSTADTVQDDDEWSMGAFTSTSARVAMAMSDDDAAGTAVVGTSVSHDEVYQNLLNTSGAVEGEMDVQSVDSDGFTLIMDDADPSQACVWYASFGQAPLTQTNSGGITPSGALAKTDNKSLSGSDTPSGALFRDVTKIFSGGVTPSGSVIKQAQRILSGAITSIAGSLATARIILKDLAGSLASSGSVFKSISKSFSGDISSTGSLQKQSNKDFSGTAAPTGSINNQGNKSLGGTLTSSGSIVKSISKFISGVIAGAGDLATQFISGGQTFFKELSGSIIPTGISDKLTGKSFSGAISSITGLLAKATSKSFTGTANGSGEINKSSGKSFSGDLSSSGSVSKLISKAFSGIVSSAGDLATQLFIAGQTFFKSIFGELTPTGSTSKLADIYLSGDVVPDGATNKATSKSVGGTLSFLGTVNKLIQKFISGIMNLVGSISSSLNPEAPQVIRIYLRGSKISEINLEGSIITRIELSGDRQFTINLKGKK